MAVKTVIFPGAFRKILDTSPQLDGMLHARALEILEEAKRIFNIQQRHDNEWRTSETTPPKYIQSFRLRRVRNLRAGPGYRVINDDPGALWVEFGAHAGGKTFVLKYRPLGRALTIVGGRH